MKIIRRPPEITRFDTVDNKLWKLAQHIKYEVKITNRKIPTSAYLIERIIGLSNQIEDIANEMWSKQL